MKNIKKKFSIGSALNHLFFILLSLCFIIPCVIIVSISLTQENDIGNYGYRFFPKHVSLMAYKFIFKNPSTILTSYGVTIFISAVTVIIYLILGSLIAYSLSRKDFRFKRPVTFYVFFTMLFNGGLVPTYILMTQYLNLRNSYAALIIPLLGNVWNIFIMRTFFQQIPESIVESASMDGAKELRIFFSMIIPLSKPVIATIGFMELLNAWNSWNPALLYVDNPKLYPLQYLLQIMLRSIEDITQNMDKMPTGAVALKDIPTESTRMAMAVIATGPMIIVFPFFQKYFVKGLTVGSVKG